MSENKNQMSFFQYREENLNDFEKIILDAYNKKNVDLIDRIELKAIYTNINNVNQIAYILDKNVLKKLEPKDIKFVLSKLPTFMKKTKDGIEVQHIKLKALVNYLDQKSNILKKEAEKKLWKAFEQKDINLFKKALNTGASPNCVNYEGGIPIAHEILGTGAVKNKFEWLQALKVAKMDFSKKDHANNSVMDKLLINSGMNKKNPLKVKNFLNDISLSEEEQKKLDKLLENKGLEVGGGVNYFKKLIARKNLNTLQGKDSH